MIFSHDHRNLYMCLAFDFPLVKSKNSWFYNTCNINSKSDNSNLCTDNKTISTDYWGKCKFIVSIDSLPLYVSEPICLRV